MRLKENGAAKKILLSVVVTAVMLVSVLSVGLIFNQAPAAADSSRLIVASWSSPNSPTPGWGSPSPGGGSPSPGGGRGGCSTAGFGIVAFLLVLPLAISKKR